MSPWISDLYLRSQTDARLLSLTRDGHSRAFAVLAERYRAELLGQARRLGSSANAEDLLQQTLLSAFAALNRGTEVGHVRGWLHAILRNAATRARGPVEAPLELAMQTGEAQDTLLEARADARLVLSALDELPARQREALVGSTVQGLSRAELATTLGVSEGAVRQLVHRARSTVRAAITSLTPYPVVRWLTGAEGSVSAGPPELALATGAAGAGGVVAKLGMVAAAGAIAASGLAVAGHHGPRDGAHASHRVHLTSGPGTTGTAVMAVRSGPLNPVSGGEFVTAPARVTERTGASATPVGRSGLGQTGAGDRRGRTHASSGNGGGGSRAANGGSTSGHDGGARGGSDGATSRSSGADEGSGGSDTSSRGPSDSGSVTGTAGSSPTGSRGHAGSGDGGSGSGGSSSGDGGSGSGGSGTGSGDATTTAATPVSTPPATTASESGGGSGRDGSNNGGGSGTATPGSGVAADGSQTAGTSTTSTGSRDLLPPAGSSLPTDH